MAEDNDSTLFSNTEYDAFGQPHINLEDGRVTGREDLDGDNRADYLDEAVETLEHYIPEMVNQPDPGNPANNVSLVKIKKLQNIKISARLGQTGGSTSLPISGYDNWEDQLNAIRQFMGVIALLCGGLVTTARTRILEVIKYDVPAVGVGGVPRSKVFNYRVSPSPTKQAADVNLRGLSEDVSLKIPFFLPERLTRPNPDFDSSQPAGPSNPQTIQTIVGVETLSALGQMLGQFIRIWGPDDVVTFIGSGGRQA